MTPAASSAAPARSSASRVGAEQVDVLDAVDLQVDEPGHGEAGPAAGARGHGLDDAVADLDVAGQQPAVDESRGDAEPHATRLRTTGRRGGGRRAPSPPPAG